MKKLMEDFFNQDPLSLAKGLLGKVIHVLHQDIVLCAQIIETEAYLLEDKASHASLGYTQKRKALFMPPGTIYMYYARGKDSLNVSAKGAGNAVLIKSCVPYLNVNNPKRMLLAMHKLNPINGRKRLDSKLMSGQTLVCKSLNLKVPEWDGQQFTKQFFIKDVNYKPKRIIQATRLGIPKGRDEHLPYRFIDEAYLTCATQRPKVNEKTIFLAP